MTQMRYNYFHIDKPSGAIGL